MARWKILTGHYLMTVDKTEWEYAETDRKTGRPIRKKFHVPRHIDPNDPQDWTNVWGSGDNREGECIVCTPGTGSAGDIEFYGDPTPDMIPLDDEAKALSASFANRWRYKPEGTESSHSQSLIDKMQSEMAVLEANRPAPKVEIEGLSELIAAMAAQTKAVTDTLIRKV